MANWRDLLSSRNRLALLLGDLDHWNAISDQLEPPESCSEMNKANAISDPELNKAK